MKVTLIATVLDEEKTIKNFLQSILRQTRAPHEIIIVDGGSTDNTLSVISNFQFPIANKKIGFKILQKKGNRSVGRNEAITHATGDIILCADAGCILDEKWVEKIIEPFKDSTVDVVAGYYKGKTGSVFEKCLVPYVLVMPNRVDPLAFLPASRSMALRKSVWKKVGGFSEKLSHNEDYVFAKKLKDSGVKIVFRRDAVVYWIPRRNVRAAFGMFFRFAMGDAEADIFRPKVIFIFTRYVLGIYVLILSLIERSEVLLVILIAGLLLYVLWAIQKNYAYVKDYRAIFVLPLLQFASDIAVLLGTIFGILYRFRIRDIRQIIVHNKAVSFLVLVYITSMLLVINWGIPNNSHPFNYFMDEWHQAQAVRMVFSQGSPNVPGAANGSMFQFFLSGIYLIPFIALGIINPFAIKSSVETLDLQQHLFQVLRLNTLLFGVGDMILFTYIAKKYFKLHPFFSLFFFMCTPLWLTLSNYFKYDIALLFWVLLSFLFFLRYIDKPSLINTTLASFLSGLSLSVKVSVLPLFALLPIVFGHIGSDRTKKIRYITLGICIYIGTFLLFGIPDLVFGKGDIREYLYDNLVRTPALSTNYNLGMHYVEFIFTRIIPITFGLSFFILVIPSIPVLLFLSRKNRYFQLLLFIIFLFILSLIPLKIEARTNRLLVLLPFLALSIGIFIQYVLKIRYARKIIIILLFFLICLQSVESFSWVAIKQGIDPRQSSSRWIEKNIPHGSTIGIENIPIYQSLPDVLLKDFYKKQYYPKKQTIFNYQVLDTTDTLPLYVVITNEQIIYYVKQTPKKDILKRLEEDGYKKIRQDVLNLYPLSFLRNDLDFFMSGIMQSPLSISIYQKASSKQ